MSSPARMSNESNGDPQRNIEPASFRPSKQHILAAAVMFLMCLMFTGHKVEYLFWVPLLPLVFILWTLRARTDITAQGISAKYLFRKSSRLSWEDFTGIRFAKSGKAFAADTHDRQFYLPGVSFNSLITLSEKTHGLIPDPVTPARRSADGKVQVVHKDGYAVLMDTEEYSEYEKQRRAEHAERSTNATTDREE